MDNEVWRWLWTIFAIVMGIGEIFTAGFFLLPFAVGAAAAAILAWFNAAILAQWLVFFGVSIFSFAFLRRYIGRQDEGEQPRVGANRWVGSEGERTSPRSADRRRSSAHRPRALGAPARRIATRPMHPARRAARSGWHRAGRGPGRRGRARRGGPRTRARDCSSNRDDVRAARPDMRRDADSACTRELPARDDEAPRRSSHLSRA